MFSTNLLNIKYACCVFTLGQCSPQCVNGNCIDGKCQCNARWKGESCNEREFCCKVLEAGGIHHAMKMSVAVICIISPI